MNEIRHRRNRRGKSEQRKNRHTYEFLRNCRSLANNGTLAQPEEQAPEAHKRT